MSATPVFTKYTRWFKPWPFFIPYLEVTIRLLISGHKFSASKKGTNAALPGRFVKKTADDQPFSNATPQAASPTPTLAVDVRAILVTIWVPGLGRKGRKKKPSGGKTHFGRRPVGPQEVSSLESRMRVWKLVTLLISELYTCMYHICIKFIYNPQWTHIYFRWCIGGLLISTPLKWRKSDGGPAGRILPWNCWWSK